MLICVDWDDRISSYECGYYKGDESEDEEGGENVR